MSLFDSSRVSFTQEELGRSFDEKTIQRGRTLILSEAVRLEEADTRIVALVKDLGRDLTVVVTPVTGARGRLFFEKSCSCGRPSCAHMAGAALLALDTVPGWRKPSLFDETPEEKKVAGKRPAPVPVVAPSTDIEPKRVAAAPRVLWTLEPGKGEVALYVSASLVSGGRARPATPYDVIKEAGKNSEGEGDRAIANLLGAGNAARAPIAADRSGELDNLLRILLASGRVRWRSAGAVTEGSTRTVRAFRDPNTRLLRPTGLPEGGSLIKGKAYWCYDPGAATLSPVEMQVIEVPKPQPRPGDAARPAASKAVGKTAVKAPAKAAAKPAAKTVGTKAAAKPAASVFGITPASRSVSKSPARPASQPDSFDAGIAAGIGNSSFGGGGFGGGGFGGGGFGRPAPGEPEATIIERSPVVVVRLGRVSTPSDGLTDVLRLSFDYGEGDVAAEIEPDDQRQFARMEEPDGEVVFVRRDKTREQAALSLLAEFGFTQGRIEPPKGQLNTRGIRVHWLAGRRDAEERWATFATVEVPRLRETGWRIDIGADFGTRVVQAGGEVAVAVKDSGDGWFDLDVGVEIDGQRRTLLPILAALVERGGMEATRVVDGQAHITMEDGNVLALPADRVARLLSVLEAMLTTARQVDDRLQVPMAEADTLLDIDDLVAKRAGETARIDAYLATLSDQELPGEIDPPAGFRGTLRDYQRVGLAWMQGLRANNVSGILADDMGLGKTAQTLAHIATEEAEGRLQDPCLVVVPTSLVPNWVAEARRFTPHLRVVVLHGLDRHERLSDMARAHIVVTTYGVVARDVEHLKLSHWHLLILDEAQAIKNPESKATRAVTSLQARHRLCLSGTPVENNLGELWSQFAFLMPGLLSDRKEFARRFRTPIEKRGDDTRAKLLLRRIRPFLLRRTKEAVAKELPPKTEVVMRIDLDREQRDLYETIRLSVNEKVRAALAASGLSRNTITVIDALLKLRQVCCDPRLVKIAAAEQVRESAKLTALMDMLKEMLPEGRRVLIFSQFTTMLDLIKARLEKQGINYVELTGRTLDRAEPVNRFQAGEVPVFLISLKAGGRGLNLTAADTVIHYDPWWNPAAEDQATDRAYRIGQDKPVFVYKLIAADTVEERILELQRRKGNLSDATIEGQGLVGALDGGDIDFLLGEAEEAAELAD